MATDLTASRIASLALAVFVIGLILAGCSSTTLPTTGEGSDVSLPSPTSAPGTTQAPVTTQAPDSTQPPSGDSESGDTSGDSSEDAAGALILILIGIGLVGLVIWGASRSGARRGAEEARMQQEAAAYEAERTATNEAGDPPPPPPVQ